MKQKKKLGIIIAIVAAVLVVGVIIFFCTKAKWNKFTGRNVRGKRLS